MTDNIISPTFTNGITIGVMGLLTFGALFLGVQAFHAMRSAGG